MTFAEQVEAYLEHLQNERRCSEHTVNAYARDLERLVLFVEDETVDAYLLRAFLAERAKQVSPSTLARQIAAIRSLFRFLLKRKMITRNPAGALRTPKRRERLPNFLTVEDALRVTDADNATSAKADQTRSIAKAHRVRRDHAIAELLYGTGMRVSECANLDVSDVDFDSRELRVIGKGNKERRLPLGQAAQEALASYLPLRSQWLESTKSASSALFVGRARRISVRQIQNVIQRIGSHAASRPDLHPHALRHTFATHLLDAGADLRSIQALLGHASLSTTQRYTHVSLDQMKAVYDRAHPLERKQAIERNLSIDDNDSEPL